MASEAMAHAPQQQRPPEAQRLAELSAVCREARGLRLPAAPPSHTAAMTKIKVSTAGGPQPEALAVAERPFQGALTLCHELDGFHGQGPVDPAHLSLSESFMITTLIQHISTYFNIFVKYLSSYLSSFHMSSSSYG